MAAVKAAPDTPLTINGAQSRTSSMSAGALPKAKEMEDNAKPERSTNWTAKLLSVLEDQWFLLGMGIVIAIASQVQVPRAHQHTKEQVVTYLCVSIIFLITGCTLDTKVLIRNYSRWKVHLFVQLQCFLLFSAIVFGIVSATATNKDFMDPGLLVGLVFLSCVATTMSSNVVMTGQARGNQELTVCQTTIGNLIGVFVSPALVVMYTSVPTWYNQVLPPNTGNFAAIYRRVLMQLGLSIYVPLAVGQIVRWRCPTICNKIFRQWKLNKIGSLSMLVIIWQTYDSAFATEVFTSVRADNMIFVVFVSIAIWALLFCATFAASIVFLPKKDVVSITYCVPAKGPAFGVPLATTMFVGLSPELESKIQ